MELIQLYREMSELTAPICANKCPNKFTCCAPEHCENAAKHAKEKYGIELERTGHETLPFMGPKGCTVEPYLRPVCTLHTCMVSRLGFQPYDSAWNAKYFALRAQIERTERA